MRAVGARGVGIVRNGALLRSAAPGLGFNFDEAALGRCATGRSGADARRIAAPRLTRTNLFPETAARGRAACERCAPAVTFDAETDPSLQPVGFEGGDHGIPSVGSDGS